ncbi:hypothetical protein LMG24238_07168 [Paraburkholderia sediminicola]|uniref:Uncharacterized protein n=1 Tax=Paraburkholderia sediminicola TaxID=458836 RepID=A0A6J5CUD9_9BURK|nr:hypothetical protein [Paraburkholderia sediminicola]CAB3743921.1 hypothetical protein LMG24238_07168 [Paraburkholderia sediminicola]
MRNGTIFSASDKSINDALSQKTVTNADLRDLFLTRGVLISKDSSRKSLAFHFSRLTHDFNDYQRLARIFGSSVHHEKLASTRIESQVSISTFENSAHELKADLEKDGAVVKVYATQGNRLDIEIKYQKLQFNKSEFRQVVSRTAVISVQREGSDLVIHGPHNDDVHEWIGKLASIASEKSGESLEFTDIQLPPTFSAKQKSDFFINLAKAMVGYNLHDVTDVYVSKPDPSSGDDDDDEAEPVQTGIHISKASLKGQGVLQSKELQLLAKKGFYISRMVWTGRSPSFDSDLYEFEAQFSSPDDCTGFVYLPRGFYRHVDGMEFASTRSGLTNDEQYRLGKVVEAAARTTLAGL